MEKKHNISDEMIYKIINTLKEIDVRGFDSMNRLVGLVMFFENILNAPPDNTENGDE